MLALALVGGALADAFDRRRLVMIAEAGALLVVGGLVVNSLLREPQLWILYVAAALIAACTAIRRPPLDALMPRLVERDVAAALPRFRAYDARHGADARPDLIEAV
jgi:MFS family permease